ncbi:MAG: CHAT domain-containing protein [Candidatus Bathyarchaeia archaeon]
MRSYDWFRVQIKHSGDEEYSITATSFLNDSRLSDVFSPPYSIDEADSLLLRIERSIREGKPLGHNAFKEIGEHLYRSIFSEEFERSFRRCLRIAKRGIGLRIELVIDPLYLRCLPWELMHDGREFLSLSSFTPIVRTVDQEQSRLPAVSFPLGVLFVVADPVGVKVPLNLGGEVRRVCLGVSNSIKEGRICLRCIRARKLKDQGFINDLKSGRYHVLHVSSHGAFVEGLEKGFLELEDGEGRAIPISIETLGTWIKDSSIQMVYLDACQTATGSVRTPLADLSYIFLEKGVAAVLAMQFSVPDKSATAFCETFYAQLVRQEPIESALTEARKRTVDPVHGLGRVDWVIPTLFVSGTGILNVEGEPRSKRYYKPLPSLGIFVGREEPLDRLTEDLVDPEVTVILVDGFGGIGKSTLIKRFVEDVGHLFTDVCWIDCESNISYDRIIEEINEMLIFHGIGFAGEDLAKYNPLERNRRIAYVLGENSEGFILVFDNFDSIKDDDNVRDLIQQISEREKIKIIITIRIPEGIVRGQSFRRIDKLEEDDAILLIRKLAEQYGIRDIERADERILKQINERLDGHPKAIEVVIPILATTPLEEVLKDLPQILASDIGEVLEWSLERLSDEERELLFEFSVFEGKVPYSALRAIHLSTPLPVAELVRKNLLSYDRERELYSLHPLIRDFVYDKLRVREENRREIHRRAAAYFLSKEGMDPIRGIEHRYKAEDWKEAIALTLGIIDSLILRGFWTEAKKLCEEGLFGSKQLKDEKLESLFYFQLSTVVQRLGEYGKAEKLYKQSLEIKEKLGDQSGIATTLHQLATIHQQRGDYGEAEKLYKQSLEIKEKLGDQSGIALTYGALGRLFEELGENTKAKSYYLKALKIFQKIGQRQYENLAKKDLERVNSKIKNKKVK